MYCRTNLSQFWGCSHHADTKNLSFEAALSQVNIIYIRDSFGTACMSYQHNEHIVVPLPYTSCMCYQHPLCAVWWPLDAGSPALEPAAWALLGLAPEFSCPLCPPTTPPTSSLFSRLVDPGARVRGSRRCWPGTAISAGPAGPGAGGRDKNTWWWQHANEKALFTECSAGTQQETRDLSMTYPWLVHDLSMTCPWLIHDLSMTCPWIFHDLSMTCPRLV